MGPKNAHPVSDRINAKAVTSRAVADLRPPVQRARRWTKGSSAKEMRITNRNESRMGAISSNERINAYSMAPNKM
jgi:hypothetical protein